MLIVRSWQYHAKPVTWTKQKLLEILNCYFQYYSLGTDRRQQHHNPELEAFDSNQLSNQALQQKDSENKDICRLEFTVWKDYALFTIWKDHAYESLCFASASSSSLTRLISISLSSLSFWQNMSKFRFTTQNSKKPHSLHPFTNRAKH